MTYQDKNKYLGKRIDQILYQ